MGVIVNNVMGTKHEMKRLDIEEICEAKVIAEVPLDRKIPESIKNMMPVVVYDRNSPAAKAFRKIAAYISGEEIELKESFWGKIKRIFRLKS
jgi:MinD-like ATPase involved in chromosome partitioning or flagellar assembly